MNTQVNLVQLRNSIETLSKEAHIEIFKIIKQENVEFSENKNGIFVNLSLVKDDIIQKLNNHMSYVSAQESIINEIETIKHNVEEEYFTQHN